MESPENALQLSKNRIDLYLNVFHQFIETIEKYNNILIEKENEIVSLRKNFYNFFQTLEINRYDISIFENFKTEIKEFKIELQLSALNAKIKSQNMQEFSNIISVIGLSLQEESFKIIRRFDELSSLFGKIIENFEHIENEVLLINHVHIQFSKSVKRLKNFIEKKILTIENNNFNDLKIFFSDLIDKFEERLVYIYYLKNNKFCLNIRKFLRNLTEIFRKIDFLLKDFYNFFVKINYLTLITKMEVGRIGEENFIVVVNTIEKITLRSYEINKEINEIFKFYQENFYKFEKKYSKSSTIIKRLIFVDYYNLLSKIKNEFEAGMKFLKNELERLQ